MKTGAVYIRVSTDMQVELSPDSQLKMIEQYAASNDISINRNSIYIDEGISGRKAEKRPAFMEMIAAAKSTPKPFDMILVWKFSRFARSREDSIVYKSMLKKECGIEVISVSEPVGDDKTAILIEALLEAMDEYYSINLAEEVRRGMTEKITRGGIVSTPPFGYSIENGIFVPNENSAIVEMIFEKYRSGKSIGEITDTLNKLGIKTTRGNRFESRNVKYILSNITYIGKLRWNPGGRASTSSGYRTFENTIIVDGGHAPIISQEIFDEVQKKFATHKSKFPVRYRKNSTEYFFRGIVRCSDCGAVLIRTQTSGSGSLQCCNYNKRRCKASHSITIKKLRCTVLEAIEKDIAMPLVISFNKNEFNLQNENTIIKKSINKERKRLKRVREAYECGVYSLNEYKEGKQKTEQIIADLNEKLNASLLPYDIISCQNKIVTVDTILSNENISAKVFNSLLLEFINKIDFDRAESKIIIHYKM